MPLPKAIHLRHAKLSLPNFHPTVGVVLGSGLGAFSEELSEMRSVPYESIPHMPQSKVSGHAGQLLFGMIDGVRVACLAGRAHAYEGHECNEVVFGVSLLAELGCRTVFLSNAAGGVSEQTHPGDLLLIQDHINLTGKNPMMKEAGPSGPIFLDMSQAYDLKLQELASEIAREQSLDLKRGVYAGLLGPTYETPAEIRMLQVMGADAVGMSTVLEVIALRAKGVRVGAVSCITNYAAGRNREALDHSEVKLIADQASSKFRKLFRSWIIESSKI